MNIRIIMLVGMIIPIIAKENTVAHKDQKQQKEAYFQGIHKIVIGGALAMCLCYFPARWGMQALRKEWRRGSLKVDDGKTDFNLQNTLVNSGLVLSPLIPVYVLYNGCCDLELFETGKEYASRVKRFIERQRKG